MVLNKRPKNQLLYLTPVLKELNKSIKEPFYRTIGSLPVLSCEIAGSLMGLKNQNNKRLLTKSNDHPTLNV
jgi:hypothetical protein